MVRKSKVNTFPKNEEIDYELIEKMFQELIQETKNKEFKAWLKRIFELFNSNDFDLNKDFIKEIGGLIFVMTITINELSRQLTETQNKLKEYQERVSHKSE